LAKTKLEITLLDIDKAEAVKDLINELLDIIETLRFVDFGNDKRWELSEIRKERKSYIDRFADIIANEK